MVRSAADVGTHTLGAGPGPVSQFDASACSAWSPGISVTSVVTQVDRADGAVASKPSAAERIAAVEPAEVVIGRTTCPVHPALASIVRAVDDEQVGRGRAGDHHHCDRGDDHPWGKSAARTIGGVSCHGSS